MKLVLRFFVLLGLFAAANGFGATARELLASPSPSVRMVGAQMLQGSYVPLPRANAEKLAADLHFGMSESAVSNLLYYDGATNVGVENIRDEIVKTFRVDDLWVIRCWFTNAVATNAVITNAAGKKVVIGKSEGGLAEARVLEQMYYVSVDPPADFSGVWLTYWANGNVSYERHFQNGLLDGVITGFYPDGFKSMVTSYRYGVPDGEDIGYFPSGRVQYQGQYRGGKEVGHWIWYREDGVVETERDYDAKGK